MKPRLKLLIFIAGWGLAGFGLVTGASAADPAWERATEPYRIAGNIYFVGTEGIGAYLIATPEGHIVLDGGPEKGAALIEANILKLGFKLKDVKYLIETHAHYDHVGGLAKLKRDTGAVFVASAADKPALESGQHVGDNVNAKGRFPAIKVDRIIANDEALTLGGVTLMAHLTPGHTPGCTSWTLATGKTHTAIFFGSMTTAGNVLIGNKAYPGIVADYRLSFKRLKAIKADIFLANHPSVAHMADKRKRQKAGNAYAFIVAGEFQTYLATAEHAFEAELKKQEKSQ